MAFQTVEHCTKMTENVELLPLRRSLLRKKTVCALLLIVGWLTPRAWSKDLAVIANKGSEAAPLSVAELAKICKAEVKRWPDGKPMTFVTRNPDAPEMKVLIEKVYEMPADDVLSLITTANHGRSNRPAIVVVSSDQEVVRTVESTPGAVGIVDVYSITGGVSVVKVGGKLPLETGYALHGN
jgi:ABC-type phosphate transport system substrate-binding protein